MASQGHSVTSGASCHELGTHRPRRLWLGLALGLALAHGSCVWGQPTVFWGDSGQVLHQIDRIAGGELPYRDFLVTSPPLAHGLLAGLVWLFGSNATTVWFGTLLLFLGVAAGWTALVGRWLGAAPGLGLGLSGGLLAMAIAPRLGSPLPLGGYNPATLTAFLALLGGLLAAQRAVRDGRLGALLGLSACAAAIVLSKQDCLPPLGWIVLCAGVSAWLRRERGRALAIAASGAVGVGVGILTLVSLTGWEGLPAMLSGYGVSGEPGMAPAFPTWEGLTREFMLVGVLGTLFGVGLGLAGGVERRLGLGFAAVSLAAALAALGLHVTMAFSIAEALQIGPSLRWPTAMEGLLEGASTPGTVLRREAEFLFQRAIRHSIPLLWVPSGAIALLYWRWRRGPDPAIDLAFAALGLSLAARLRRGFDGLEWFHALLDLPALVLILRAGFGARADRLLRYAPLVVLCWSAVVWWNLGSGPLTADGVGSRYDTPRGTVRWDDRTIADHAWLLETLDARDPERARGVFSFGHNGGWAYWLDRPNPTPMTYGFTFSTVSRDAGIAAVRAADPAIFLVRSRAYDRLSLPAVGLHLDRWEARMRPSRLGTEDGPIFDAIAAECQELTGHPPSRPFFRAWDCAGLAR